MRTVADTPYSFVIGSLDIFVRFRKVGYGRKLSLQIERVRESIDRKMT